MGPGDPDAALARIRLVALDVDGTLTDGRVTYIGSQELMSFSARDGQGIRWLVDAGIEVVWITGRGCAATDKRAAELGVRAVLRGGSKQQHLMAVQEELGVTREETLAMGDDLPDLGLARAAGMFCAPADAAPELRAAAGLVCAARGGRGAVREIAERLLRARGAWIDGEGPRTSR